MEMKLSSTEQVLYDFIKETGETRITTIEKELGSKFVGAIGGLVSRGILEGYKKRVSDSVKYVKFFKIKEIK